MIASNSQRSACLCLLNAGIKGVPLPNLAFLFFLFFFFKGLLFCPAVFYRLRSIIRAGKILLNLP
ncbi:similar to RIKEN cDNA 2610207I16, isoform CRA_a [Rattus norvegicus]|uniref:Similar to RIKEN cDNA 2610207I16, isoform CRA_a n=1 Tax=Rattus norvegicus TaxID=10116 RepID=A6KDX0_RAT|nr:similar to RIKEN cDNA 2610207I16, isoform CRA_a [Rattus norvegicus]